ncbi:EAL domain-containing protein (putative c-di-GMP-specific phosphodiesterase class I)/CHASE2 domain-containing sensor protein [Sphingopyxis sp. OAS728]|uniref:EAL domain-containing protein n=1 Tax=Sphingopyxis sp. OAS728 TaxID=2663823 RepID=UPI00178C00FE|nr:EAL domain-containing protein [Sphingopyxis sp. OAS728]MBE1527409.1 EAL domain-containing protein (putative c-di-GMP-specific phosphodiesterase class I)/CHASE2 domain-containing sensor protein [Sphingopyxis sp. OAS728]
MPIQVKSLIISWRSIGLSLLLSVVVGLTAVSEPIDRVIEAAIGRVAWRPVPDDIVVVALDDRTLAEVAGRDFSMTRHAQLVDAIDRAGAKRLFIDFTYDRREKDADFPFLTKAVQRMGNRAVLAVAAKSARSGNSELARFPSPSFGTAAQIACIGWEYELWQVWRIPITLDVNGRAISSFSSLLANRRSAEASVYALDYSYKTNSITEYSASDVLSGKVSRELAGRDVIFAPTAAEFQDSHYLPGHDRVPGAYVHVIGAETLKRGMPTDIGWLPQLIVAAVILIGATGFRRARRFNLVAAALVVAVIVSKIYLTTILVSSSVGAALFLAAAISANVSRTSRRRSAQRENPVSGLPNFEALRSQSAFGSATVVAAKVVNFEDLAAFIPGDGIGKLVEQVTRRLQLASQGTTLHHDLDGTFAWLVPYYQHSQIEGQLAGLAALFNAPLTIGELRVDVAIAFGVNDEFEGSNAQRLAAALVAAERAIRTRSLWTKYTSRQKEDAGWQLSFHSQLEDALTGGDIWVAFQPQYEIATNKLVGVEALARWTHPTRGPIPPDEFIVQAEKSQDIYRLTLFVMDQAIRSAAQLRERGIHINMSVNLSASLLDHNDLVGTIRVMLTAHHLPPETLTIEITETAQIENSRQARQTLAQLRRTGIRLSIDDYGTGQSNLEYLTEIEADEIKIDKRFVMTMRDSQRNLEVVKSTIDLAHRLGAVAVAEGIEDAETMALLASLGCDVGQGYHLGKPQLFSELTAALAATPQHRSA